MAIDDNTSYELTGYQVKDLAQKIRAKADSSSLASVATSGLYSDLTGAPTIPTVYNGTLTIQQNGTTLGTFSANQDTNETINITGGGGTSATIFYLDDDFGLAPHICTDSGHTTYATATDINNALDAGPVIISDGSYCAEITAFNKTGGMANTGQWEFVYSPDVYVFSFIDNTNIVWDTLAYQPKLMAGTGININASDVISAPAMTGAAASTAGSAGIVPAPAAGDEGKVLHGDGTWKDTTAKLVEMSYGESNAWAKFIAAYNAGSIVYCRASSGSNPGSGSQTRKAFMAYVNNATNPTEVEFQYVRSVSTKTSSQPVDQVFVYKLTSSGGGTWSVATRDMGPKIAAGTGINVSYSNGTYTISLA